MAIEKKAETKETIEKEAVKAVAEKDTVKAAAPSVAEKKEPEKKAPAKREPVKKETDKKEATKKEPVKKAAPAKKTAVKEVKAKVFIQYDGKEILADTLVDAAKKSYMKAGNKAADIKTIEVYVKPEENAAYYAVNGEGSEERKIML